VIEPTYYPDFLPNTEVEFPIGFTYDLFGRSQVDATMNHGTGAVSVGVTAVYKATWTAGLTYNDYIGAPNPNLQGSPGIADRGYLSFNVEHTF
jgi:hypothetical protein